MIGIVFVVLAVGFFLLRNSLKNNSGYAHSFDPENCTFSWHSYSDIGALILLISAFVMTAIYSFSLENSLFENYDLMTVNTIMPLTKGVTPVFDYYRIPPLSFWYLNFLYAVTENIYLIKLFVLAQLGLAIFLLYILFRFIPVAKRLIMLAVFMMMPVMLQTTNIIFIERSLFIYLAAGLICAQNYCKTGKLKWAAWFLFFMNFSIYVKETAILFYFGLISTSIIYQIWNEQINLKSFLHPFRTIKQMPLEFLMILSLFLYSVIYFLLLSLKVNYHVDNSFSLGFLLDYYKFELIFIATASLILGLNTFKSLNSSANPLFSSGSFLFGGICVTAGVVFVLHLAPISPHLNTRTYYLVIPMLFSLA